MIADFFHGQSYIKHIYCVEIYILLWFINDFNHNMFGDKGGVGSGSKATGGICDCPILFPKLFPF